MASLADYYAQIFAGDYASEAQRGSSQNAIAEADAADKKRALILEGINQLSEVPTSKIPTTSSNVFKDLMSSISSQYGVDKLKTFEPGVLSSPSYSEATKAVQSQMTGFGTNLLSNAADIAGRLQSLGSDFSSKLGSQAGGYISSAKQTGQSGFRDLTNLATGNIYDIKSSTKTGADLLTQTSERGSKRQSDTLTAPYSAFAGTLNNPIFSNINNSKIMDLIKNPGSRTYDIASMRDLWTYNV